MVKVVGRAGTIRLGWGRLLASVAGRIHDAALDERIASGRLIRWLLAPERDAARPRAGVQVARGRVKVKVAPGPSLLRTVRAPPWAVTVCLAMARPRPVPPPLRALSAL